MLAEVRPVYKLRVAFLEELHRPFPRLWIATTLPDFIEPPRITPVTPHDFDPSNTKPSRDPDVDRISFGDDAGRFGFCCRHFEGQIDTLQGITVLSNCKLTEVGTLQEHLSHSMAKSGSCYYAGPTQDLTPPSKLTIQGTIPTHETKHR